MVPARLDYHRSLTSTDATTDPAPTQSKCHIISRLSAWAPGVDELEKLEHEIEDEGQIITCDPCGVQKRCCSRMSSPNWVAFI